MPHYLPGQKSLLIERTKRFGVPEAAVGRRAGNDVSGVRKSIAGSGSQRTSSGRKAPPPSPAAVDHGPPDFDKVKIIELPVQGNVYVLAGAGSNITVQVGEFSVLVVDTQYAPLSGKILAAIGSISNKPIRYVVNTSFDPDHTAETPKFQKPAFGRRPVRGGYRRGFEIGSRDHRAGKRSQQDERAYGVKDTIPFAAWPTETYATPEYELFNGEGIRIIHEPAAHTDGDSMCFSAARM